MNQRRRIAIVGGGVAGITAAHLLQRAHDVTVFEADFRLGGHTNTVIVKNGPDAGVAVDTGFIVMNDKTYPNLHALLKDLDVPVRWSDMSFAYHCELSKFSYAGTTLNGIFADRGNLFRPSFYRFLLELMRFCSSGERDLLNGTIGEQTMREYLSQHAFSQNVLERYILPMGAAIWSAPRDEILDFPASAFLRFFHNHGLLSLKNRPRWQTVVGGSSAYVTRFIERFGGTIRLNAPVAEIRRRQNPGNADGQSSISIQLKDGQSEQFDCVVLAAHADQSLQMLADPSAEEQRVLGAWRYQQNHTVLHTDIAALPPKRRAWASWNYVREPSTEGHSPVSVTYHMNRLQGLQTENDYCVSLNRIGPIRPETVVYETYYAHPVYNSAAVASQADLPSLNGIDGTYFCGSYFGYGFHEDAVNAGAAVALAFGLKL